jgi:hypothetical protein
MPRSHALRTLRNATLACCGLALGCALIRAATPDPYVHNLSEKLERFGHIKDSVDAVFVGSSRVHRHLSPRVFDRVVAEHGHASRSFNLGVPASKMVEILAMLERLREMAPPRLRWVLIEPDGLVVDIAEQNVRTSRAISWHDPAHTVLAIRSVLELGGPRVDRLAVTRRHLQASLYHAVNAGRLRDALVDAFAGRPSATSILEVLGPEGDGFDPHELTPSGRASGRHQSFVNDLGRYRRRVARTARAIKQPTDDCLSGFHADILARMVTVVEAAGAEPVFVVSPVTESRCGVVEAARQGVIPTLLAFNDPDRYPELYRVENRYDNGHLNRRGAEIYTRMVATGLVDSLASRAGAGR